MCSCKFKNPSHGSPQEPRLVSWSRGGESSGNSNTIFVIVRCTLFFLVLMVNARTRSSLPLCTFTILPKGHSLRVTPSSFIMTIVSTLKSRFMEFNFKRSWRELKNSFLHLLQNSLVRCWTRFQYLREKVKGSLKLPGGDRTISYFVVRRLLRERGVRLMGLFKHCTVNGWVFNTFSISQNRVRKDSS